MAIPVIPQPTPRKCRYGCGADVYRFTDAGIPRQVLVQPVFEDGPHDQPINMLWRYRGKHVGWIPGSPYAETVYMEHDCDNTPRHLKPNSRINLNVNPYETEARNT